MCDVGQFNIVKAAAVWSCVIDNVASVGKKEEQGYFRALFGQFNDMIVCEVRIDY